MTGGAPAEHATASTTPPTRARSGNGYIEQISSQNPLLLVRPHLRVEYREVEGPESTLLRVYWSDTAHQLRQRLRVERESSLWVRHVV